MSENMMVVTLLQVALVGNFPPLTEKQLSFLVFESAVVDMVSGLPKLSQFGKDYLKEHMNVIMKVLDIE